MANRRISDLPEIAGSELAEEDLFTVVHVFEVDPALKNKKLTVAGTKQYFDLYYFPRTGGIISGDASISGNFTVDKLTTTSGLIVTNQATVSGLIVQNSATVSGTISGITITGGTIQGSNINGTTVTATSGNFTNLVFNNTLISVALGSAASPSISFSGDSNTGIYSPGANNVALTTDGAERMRIDSSGRLLVGTSTARSVGYHGPGEALIQNETPDSNICGINLIQNRSSDNIGPYVRFAKTRGSNVGSNTVVQNGDEVGGLQFCGADGTDLTNTAASIVAFVDGTPGANDMPGRLVFSTSPDGAASPTERLRINSSGQVAISLGDVDSGAPEPWPVANEAGYPPTLTLQNYYAQCLVLSDAPASLGVIPRFGVIAGARRNPAHKAFTAFGVGDTGSNRFLYIGGGGWYAPEPNEIAFYTAPTYNETDDAGVLRASFTSDGYLRMAANSGGIQFNGDTSAVNALDDYEEGTWIPTMIGSSIAGTATYSNRDARYTKIGRMVQFEFWLTWSGGTGTGSLLVQGLPFVSANSNSDPSCAIGFFNNISLIANNFPMAYIPANGSTEIVLVQFPTGGGGATTVAYDAAGEIQISGCYSV